MSKHTPGPWRVFTTQDGTKLIGIGDASGQGVADCGFGIWGGGEPEALANARFIAASPDLLEACKAINRAHTVEAHGEALDKVVAAIAKATAEDITMGR